MVGSFRRYHVAAVCPLVLARVSNCREVLSTSLLRGRRSSDRRFFVVLEHRVANRDIGPHADPLDHGAYRFIHSSAIEVFRSFPLVADGHDSLHRRRRLRQSPSMVPTPARADHRRFCGRRLCVYRIENLLFARCRGHILGPAYEFIRSSCLSPVRDPFMKRRLFNFAMLVWK